MAIPTYVVGTGVGGTTAGEPYAPAWPTHQANDWGYLCVETEPDDVITITPGAGGETWTECPSSPQQSSTNLATGTRFRVYEALALSSSMAAPTVSGLSNHGWCVILRVRGAHTAATAVHKNAGSTALAATTVSFPSVTTTVADCLILNILSRAFDSASAQSSAQANAALANVAEVYDLGTAAGNGGGIVIIAGDLATFGVVGNTTATLANASDQALITLAIMPPQGGGFVAGPMMHLMQIAGGLA